MMNSKRSPFQRLITKPVFLLGTLFFALSCTAQKTDTLKFYSTAFKQERTVYIHTPTFYKYQSDSTKLPVFYILDGQNEWFLNPTLSSIRYLQYTHEIPQAILVIIPLQNRNKECGIVSLDQPEAPLHAFITRELNEKLAAYHPGDYKVLIGHSFSASFSLYSYLLSPTFYSAIISNSPLDQLENLIKSFEAKSIDKSRLYLSYGATDKDSFHRKGYEEMKVKYPSFFKDGHVFLANSSSHIGLPILAVPELLSELFYKFPRRYANLVHRTDMGKLAEAPAPIANIITAIRRRSILNGQNYPPEYPDVNGIASNFTPDYPLHAIAIYELGLQYYSNAYSFHYKLAQLYAGIDKVKAKMYADKTIQLLQTIPETNSAQLIKEVQTFITDKGL